MNFIRRGSTKFVAKIILASFFVNAFLPIVIVGSPLISAKSAQAVSRHQWTKSADDKTIIHIDTAKKDSKTKSGFQEVGWVKSGDYFMERASGEREPVQLYHLKDQKLRASAYPYIVDGEWGDPRSRSAWLQLIVQETATDGQVLGIVYNNAYLTNQHREVNPFIPSNYLNLAYLAVGSLGAQFQRNIGMNPDSFFDNPTNRVGDKLGWVYVVDDDQDASGDFNNIFSSVWPALDINRNIRFGDQKDNPSNGVINNYADSFKQAVQGKEFPMSFTSAKVSDKLKGIIDGCYKENIASRVNPSNTLPEDIAAYLKLEGNDDLSQTKPDQVFYGDTEKQLTELWNNFYRLPSGEHAHTLSRSNAAQAYYLYGTYLSSFESNIVGNEGAEFSRAAAATALVALSLIPITKGAILVQGAVKTTAAATVTTAAAKVAAAKTAETAALKAAAAAGTSNNAATAAAVKATAEVAKVEAAEKVAVAGAAKVTDGVARGAAAKDLVKAGINPKQLIGDVLGVGIGVAAADWYISKLNGPDRASIRSNMLKQAIAKYYMEKHIAIHECVLNKSTGIPKAELEANGYTKEGLDDEIRTLYSAQSEAKANAEVAAELAEGDGIKDCPIASSETAYVGWVKDYLSFRTPVCFIINQIVGASAAFATWSIQQMLIPALSLN